MNGLNAFAAEGGKKHIVVACPFAGVLARRESQQLIRGISPVSLLAAVDGAALLDEHLRTQGFGVRFPVLLHPESKVENAINGRKVFVTNGDYSINLSFHSVINVNGPSD